MRQWTTECCSRESRSADYKKITEVDPDFAKSYCFTVYLRLFGGVGLTHPRVSLELRAARARRTRVLPREQAQLDAFDTAATGEFSSDTSMYWGSV